MDDENTKESRFRCGVLLSALPRCTEALFFENARWNCFLKMGVRVRQFIFHVPRGIFLDSFLITVLFQINRNSEFEEEESFSKNAGAHQRPKTSLAFFAFAFFALCFAFLNIDGGRVFFHFLWGLLLVDAF